jgi:GntR family transcriptional regulator
MDREWNDSQPIYRQLRDLVVAMILDRVLTEGDPLPSVRHVAAEYRVNPITVLKSYQQLVDEQLVEKRRGLGMFVKPGARDLLLQGERQKFLTEQWPRVYAQSMPGAVGVSLNAVLIIIFAVLAWRSALTRDVSAHRRWALRTYLVANGQWFIRVGFMAWMILNQGHDRGFYRFWNFGCYLLPLAVLELYLRAKESAGPRGRYAMAAGLVALTVLMGVGIFGLSMFYGKVMK